MSSENSPPFRQSREFSGIELVQKVGRDVFHYLPRFYLRSLREHPIQTVGLTVAAFGLALSLSGNALVGYPMTASGAIIYIFGLGFDTQSGREEITNGIRSIKSFANKVNDWWADYKRS